MNREKTFNILRTAVAMLAAILVVLVAALAAALLLPPNIQWNPS